MSGSFKPVQISTIDNKKDDTPEESTIAHERRIAEWTCKNLYSFWSVGKITAAKICNKYHVSHDDLNVLDQATLEIYFKKQRDDCRQTLVNASPFMVSPALAKYEETAKIREAMLNPDPAAKRALLAELTQSPETSPQKSSKRAKTGDTSTDEEETEIENSQQS
jgi:hypothetical protein